MSENIPKIDDREIPLLDEYEIPKSREQILAEKAKERELKRLTNKKLQEIHAKESEQQDKKNAEIEKKEKANFLQSHFTNWIDGTANKVTYRDYLAKYWNRIQETTQGHFINYLPMLLIDILVNFWYDALRIGVSKIIAGLYYQPAPLINTEDNLTFWQRLFVHPPLLEHYKTTNTAEKRALLLPMLAVALVKPVLYLALLAVNIIQHTVAIFLLPTKFASHLFKSLVNGVANYLGFAKPISKETKKGMHINLDTLIKKPKEETPLVMNPIHQHPIIKEDLHPSTNHYSMMHHPVLNPMGLKIQASKIASETEKDSDSDSDSEGHTPLRRDS